MSNANETTDKFSSDKQFSSEIYTGNEADVEATNNGLAGEQASVVTTKDNIVSTFLATLSSAPTIIASQAVEKYQALMTFLNNLVTTTLAATKKASEAVAKQLIESYTKHVSPVQDKITDFYKAGYKPYESTKAQSFAYGVVGALAVAAAYLVVELNFPLTHVAAGATLAVIASLTLGGASPKNFGGFGYAMGSPVITPTAYIGGKLLDVVTYSVEKISAGLKYAGGKISAGLQYAGEKISAGLQYAGEKTLAGLSLLGGLLQKIGSLVSSAYSSLSGALFNRASTELAVANTDTAGKKPALAASLFSPIIALFSGTKVKQAGSGNAAEDESRPSTTLSVGAGGAGAGGV